MYQSGDLVWIPQGAVLHRKRVPSDDLYSVLSVTSEPKIGVYAGISKVDPRNNLVMIENKLWEVEGKEMSFYLSNREAGYNVYQFSRG